MTVKDYKTKYEGQFVDVEVYVDRFKPQFGFHTDFIKAVDVPDDTEVLEADLMNKEEYSTSVLANVCTQWSDYGWEDDDKVLVLKVEKKED